MDSGSRPGTSEADDLRAILGYLGLSGTSGEAREISGLTGSTISSILAGRRRRDTSRRDHIATVAAVIRELASAREAATGSPSREGATADWLHTTTVTTTRGAKTALEVLADEDLAKEALAELMR